MEFLSIHSPKEVDWVSVKARNCDSDICLALEDISLDIDRISRGFREDLVHVGPFFYSEAVFELILLAAPNWFFLEPPRNFSSSTWMATAHVLVLKKGVLANVEIDSSYESPHVVAADIAFQILRRGGLVKSDPSLLCSMDGGYASRTSVSRNDLKRFVLRFFGKRAAVNAFPFEIFSILLSPKIQKVSCSDLKNSLLIDTVRRKEIGHYAAVIPTINRYGYLKKAIYSLLRNRRPPVEIIIVDQTPVGLRIEGYYDEFSSCNVKVFFSDQPGQSTSRNLAVSHVSTDWILFFDDDSEAWDDMIESHIQLLEYSTADVSTGVSLAPWKDRSYIKGEISFFHIAPVLDTGNCMMRKSLVQAIGSFDPAFDKGSGADDNLGKRLFLAGALIIFNPNAIRTHHKAAVGGLRQHGAWWKNKGKYFGPFPLPTESYDFLRFYPSRFYIRLCIYRLLTSYRRSGIWMNVINTLFFPIKVFVSYLRGRLLLSNAPEYPKTTG